MRVQAFAKQTQSVISEVLQLFYPVINLSLLWLCRRTRTESLLLDCGCAVLKHEEALAQAEAERTHLEATHAAATNLRDDAQKTLQEKLAKSATEQARAAATTAAAWPTAAISLSCAALWLIGASPAPTIPAIMHHAKTAPRVRHMGIGKPG